MGIAKDFPANRVIRETTTSNFAEGALLDIPGNPAILSGHYVFLYNGQAMKEGAEDDYTIDNPSTGVLKLNFAIRVGSNLTHLLLI